MVLHAEEAGLDRGLGDDSVVSLESLKTSGLCRNAAILRAMPQQHFYFIFIIPFTSQRSCSCPVLV